MTDSNRPLLDTKADRPVVPSPIVATFWMFGAITSFALMTISGREAGATLDTFEIMTYRSLVGVLIVVSIGLVSGKLCEVRTNRLGTHLARNISHFIGQNLWFMAIMLIPLAQVVALEFSYPVWVALAAPLLLGERLTRIRLGACLLGFIGIMVVVRPGFETLNAGSVAALFCAFGFAGSALITKRLTRDQSIICIMFWMTVLQAIMGLLCAGFDGDIAVPDSAVLPWVILIGCAGLSAHFCLTNALAIAPATLVTPIDFARLPVIATLGALLYGEKLDPFVFIGSAIIFAAIYILVLSRVGKNDTPGRKSWR